MICYSTHDDSQHILVFADVGFLWPIGLSLRDIQNLIEPQLDRQMRVELSQTHTLSINRKRDDLMAVQESQ
jgi:hypothetical protein